MKIRMLAIFLTGIIMFIFTGCGMTGEVNTNTEKENDAIQVNVYDVTKTKIEDKKTISGKIMPESDVDVYAKVAGKVTDVKAETGDKVDKGNVLFTIDDEDLRLQVNQSKAALEVARTNLERAKGGSTEQQVNQLKNAVVSAEINLKDAKANYERIKQLYESGSNLELAEKNYQQALSSYETAKKLSEADSNLKSLETAYEDATQNYQRTKALYEAGAVSRQMLESAESNVKMAEDKLESATISRDQNIINAETALKAAEDQLNSAKILEKQNLETAQSRVELAEEQYAYAVKSLELTTTKINPENIAVMESQLNQAQAAYDLAKSQLDNCIVKSPISGIVATININEGDFVTSAVPAFNIVNISSVFAQFFVTEDIANKVGEKDEYDIYVNSVSKEPFKGTFISISPNADQRTQTFQVRMSLDNEDEQLKGGMMAEFIFVQNESKDVLVVPIDSIINNGEESIVYVVEAGKAYERVVEKGIMYENLVEVSGEIKENDIVVVKGQNLLEDGSKVKVN